MTIEAVIGGNSKNVARAEVEYSICKHSGTCEIVLDPSEKSGFNTFDTLKLYANGKQIFGGYVDKVSLRDSPYSLTVTGNCELLKADRTFFKDEYISDGETTKHWIEFFLNKASISNYTVEGTDSVYEGHSWSVQTCMEAIENLIQIENKRLYVDRTGKVCIKSKADSSPVLTFSKYADVERLISDATIRNRAVVFGSEVTADIQESNSYLVSGEVRTLAISTSLIEVLGEAQRLANAILKEYRDPLDVRKFTIDGYPEISINDYVSTPFGDEAVTSLSHKYDAENFTTEITIGEKCPSFFGIALITPPLFASTVGEGVWRTDDGGINWYDISGTTLNKTTVNAIHSDETYLWAITDNNIYRSTDKTGLWQLCSIPASFSVSKFDTVYTVYKSNLRLYDIITKNNFVLCVCQDTYYNRIVVLISDDNFNFNYIYMV